MVQTFEQRDQDFCHSMTWYDTNNGQQVVLVMQSCSHDAPYGEYFRVQDSQLTNPDSDIQLSISGQENCASCQKVPCGPLAV